MLNVGWDTETHLIGAPDNLIPPIVCGAWDAAPPKEINTQWRDVISTGDPALLWERMRDMWQSAYQGDIRIIIHNAAFDVAVALRYAHEISIGERVGDPAAATELTYLIWETLERSMDNEWEKSGPILVSDTMMREKLLNLSTRGSMTVSQSGRNIGYSLADLAMKWLKVNLFAGKVQVGADGKTYDADGNDITGTKQAASAWRLRYKELDGLPTAQWPTAAWEYAWDDAYYARLIWDCQEQAANTKPGAAHRSMHSESLQVYSAVALQICTATGFRIDQEQVGKVTSSIAGVLDRLEQPLRENGIIRSNGSVNTKLVKEHCIQVWDWLERQPLLTKGGDIATSKEAMEIIAEYNPVLQAYAERQKLVKIRDAFLPSLQGPMVWTNFDNPKETGRTSSKGSGSKKRRPLYPAINSQQMPRREGVRECFLPPLPPPGSTAPYMLMNSNDYGMLELCGVGQVTYYLLKKSVHRDKINQGYDLHSYLGSAIAQLKYPALVQGATDMDHAYAVFMDHRSYRPPRGYLDDQGKPYQPDSTIEDRRHLAKQAKHYRNLAKPVGLGYPGGLAERTMMVFAQTVYGVELSENEASELKELWLYVYPEMVEYFKWVRNARDMTNKDSEGVPKYCYTTPGFGRFRAGTTYCATANGSAMQSLAADGAKRSACWIVRAASGGLAPDNPFRILDQCAYLTFIHDEHLTAMPADPLATERSMAISHLMTMAMQMHMPDVRITAEPALMRRWRKGAEPEWVPDTTNERGRAYDLAVQTYGAELGAQMIEQFASPDGRRLVDYETIHGEAIKEVV